MFIFLQVACVFGSSEDDLVFEKTEKELDFVIESTINNNYFVNKITLVPRQTHSDCFYLIESPDLQDSVFSSISYSGETTPVLEDLFPDHGMFLIYDGTYSSR